MLMGRAFPRSVFHGYDYHPASIDRARILAEEGELDARAQVRSVAARELGTAEHGAQGTYDPW